MKRRRLWAIGLGALVALLIPFYLHHWAPASHGAPARPPYLTYFLLDGLTQPVFERELQAGHLPNIAALISQGLWVKDGIAAFPSMTGYGFYPFVSGQDAAATQVSGLRWLDRSREEGGFRNYVGRTFGLMNEDFGSKPKTVFERVLPFHSSTFNSYVNRGAKRKRMFGWNFSMAKYREQSAVVRALSRLPGVGPWLFPDWLQAETMVVNAAIADLPLRPKVQWVTFTSPDGRHHLAGMDETYVALVRHADAEIGRYREASRGAGQESERIYAVLSDHGMVDVKTNVDLRASLEAAGLRAWRGQPTHLSRERLSEPWADWDKVDAIVAINGNMLAHVYLRGSSGWRSPPSAVAVEKAAEQLRASAGVELVLQRKQRSVLVVGRQGTGEIQAGTGGTLLYRCAAGPAGDPLGYGGPLCDGQARSTAQWLEATHAMNFPDAVFRVWSVMRQKGSGDLVVTALPGFDFGLDYEMVVGNYRGGHGGLRADQLRVPYVLAGPGIPHALIPTARAEDVGATLLGSLGLEPEAGTTGRSLLK